MTNGMVDMATASAIKAGAMESRSNLEELEDKLQQEVDEISLAAAREKRPLSDRDINRLDALQANLDKVVGAKADLAFTTLVQMDNSADVAELKNKLDGINAKLGDDLQRLKNIARYAAIAAKVADGLAQLGEKVAGALLKA